jgi:hypothetical protein
MLLCQVHSGSAVLLSYIHIYAQVLLLHVSSAWCCSLGGEFGADIIGMSLSASIVDGGDGASCRKIGAHTKL